MLNILFTFVFIFQSVESIPVIIDTDIGGDIDDSWALALAIQSPNMDLKLVLTANNDTRGRAQIVAKYLTIVGRDTIPIGIGVPTQSPGVGPLYGWASSYDLRQYKGGVSDDGVGAAIEIIRNSPEPVTILAIAPLGNFKALLNRAPELASKIIIKAMSGSYKYCYNKGPGPCPEYNVAANISASQETYGTVWNTSLSISPIDIGMTAFINGENYQKLLSSTNIVTSTLLQCYIYWNQHGGDGDTKSSSTTLWDPTAAYMVFSDSSLMVFQNLKMVVNSRGETVVDTNGRPVNVATSWVNNGEQMWSDLVVSKLIGS
jgi:inosine-uridine nucleoside N-ribohydrolase